MRRKIEGNRLVTRQAKLVLGLAGEGRMASRAGRLELGMDTGQRSGIDQLLDDVLRTRHRPEGQQKNRTRADEPVNARRSHAPHGLQ